jgi:pimeloyl-ACP methyl ester carboxylesterase
VLLAPAATLAPIPVEFYVRVFSSGLMRSPALARGFVQWLSDTPDAASDPTLDLIATSLLSCRPLRTEVTPPTVLKDDDLRRISAPSTVLIGDREVMYRSGPQAALARAQTLIPNGNTHLLPGANHTLTLDRPGQLADGLSAALA